VSRRNLALALGIACAALMAITALYVLVTSAFAQVNPAAAAAAISVAVAGIAWFRKANSFRHDSTA
jgi:hypothetical protein